MTRLVVREWFTDGIVVNLGLVFVSKLEKINVIKKGSWEKEKTQSIIILFEAESDVKIARISTS